MKIITWNINGLRAAITKGLWSKLEQIEADIVCLQEIKTDHLAMQKLIKDQHKALTNWHIFWHSAIKKGYSGTAILYKKSQFKFLKPASDLGLFEGDFEMNLASNLEKLKLQEVSIKPINLSRTEQLDFDQVQTLETALNNPPTKNQLKSEVLQEIIGLENDVFDCEGRTTGLIWKTNDSKNSQTFLLLNCYYPQGGRPGRVDYKVLFYRQVLEFVLSKKLEFTQLGIDLQIILTGDFNTTFADIDLARPKENRQTTGCLPVEREILNLLAQKLNLVDIYRAFWPEVQEFTYWDQITRARERNSGWRIDFFLVSQSLNPLNNQSDQTNSILKQSFNVQEKSNLTENSLPNQLIYNPLTNPGKNFNLQISEVKILGQIMGSDHCPVSLKIS